MAENFAAFDYKTQEEVITVIKYLTVILSTTGMQLLEMISPSHLLKQLHSPLEPAPRNSPQPNPEAVSCNSLPWILDVETRMQNVMDVDIPPPLPSSQSIPAVPASDEINLDKLPLMRTSVIIAMVMLLKVHLKSLYSLSEEYVPMFLRPPLSKLTGLAGSATNLSSERRVPWVINPPQDVLIPPFHGIVYLTPPHLY